MGLDAYVYCDCYEKGRLREPPPPGVILCVEPDGALGRVGNDATIEDDLAWDVWREKHACRHAGGIFLRHYLGNLAMIGLLRSELRRDAARFPVLTTKVVYTGWHTGDFLKVETLPALQRELESLRAFQCTTRERDEFMSEFRNQMTELATAALSIQKPLAF